MYLDAACVVVFTQHPENGDIGQLKLLLGDSMCRYNQEAWLSPPLDSNWQRYKVEFVPDGNYDYLAIGGWCITPNKVGIEWVDNLSSIYVETDSLPIKINNNNAYYNGNNKRLEVWCNVTNENNTTLVLYNMLGQQLAMQPCQNNTNNYMDVATLPAAIYLLELKAADGKKLWYQKVMKW